MGITLQTGSAPDKLKDFNAIADQLPAMVALYNISNGEYIYVNRAVNRILGYEPKQFISGGIEFVTGLVHPDDLPRIIKENQEAIDSANKPGLSTLSAETIISFEYRMRHKTGRWVWLQTDGSVYNRGDDGRVSCVLNVSIDITKRKSSEKKLQDEAQRLTDLNRSKDEFVAIASHQLRTPATAVRQYLGLLLEGYSGQLTPAQEQFVREAFENNDRQLKIVNDILQVARLDLDKVKLHLKRRDIVAKVASVVSGLKEELAVRKQKIVIKRPQNARLVLVDPVLMKSVVENILENASKYSQAGRNIEVSFQFGTEFVDIIVKDQGVGIDAGDFPRLFQKFSRIDNPLSVEVGGTGLGLYWASKVVGRHGGQIRVDSEVGKGSTFIISLPIDGPNILSNYRQGRFKL